MARRTDGTSSRGNKWAAVVLVILVLFPLQDGWAWGAMGHRIVGEIAQSRLLPEVQTQIRENFNIKKLSDVANWADTVRKKRFQGSWHYCNIKETEWTYAKHRDCPDGACVVEKIREFSQILEDADLSSGKRNEALKYLIHFVGDVHQPLHLGNARDRGGNEIRLRFKGIPTDLHALWDGKLIRPAWKSLVQYARDLSFRTTEAESKEWNSSKETDWANESRALALRHAYVLDPSRKRRLSKNYIVKSRKIIELRLSQAGVRLAGLLNRLLSPNEDAAPGKDDLP